MTTHVKARCLKYICQRPPIQACLSWVRTWSTCCRIIFVIILLRFQMSSGSSKMSVLHFVTYHQHATLQMPRQRWCVTRRLRAKPKRKPTIPAVLHAVPLLLPPSLSLSLSLASLATTIVVFSKPSKVCHDSGSDSDSGSGSGSPLWGKSSCLWLPALVCHTIVSSVFLIVSHGPQC